MLIELLTKMNSLESIDYLESDWEPNMHKNIKIIKDLFNKLVKKQSSNHQIRLKNFEESLFPSFDKINPYNCYNNDQIEANIYNIFEASYEKLNEIDKYNENDTANEFQLKIGKAIEKAKRGSTAAILMHLVNMYLLALETLGDMTRIIKPVDNHYKQTRVCYIYIKPSVYNNTICEIGKIIHIPKLHFQYGINALKSGYFNLIFEVSFEKLNEIEQLIQQEFYNSKTESYDEKIIEQIELFFKNKNIKYKKLGSDEINNLIEEYTLYIKNNISVSYKRHLLKDILQSIETCTQIIERR